MNFENESQPVRAARVTVIEVDGSRTTYDVLPLDVRRRINDALNDGSAEVSFEERLP